MSVRTKHLASLVTAALLAVAMPAPGQQAPNEGMKQPEGSPPRISLLRPALEAAAESVWVKALDIPDPPAGTWGFVATGTGGGAIFRDADSEAEAWLGTNYIGVMGFGGILGGFFADSDGSGNGKGVSPSLPFSRKLGRSTGASRALSGAEVRPCGSDCRCLTPPPEFVRYNP